MTNFPEPSEQFSKAISLVQDAIEEMLPVTNKVSFFQGLTNILGERLPAESLEKEETRWYIHHSIEVCLNAAEHFYAKDQTLEGDLQVVRALIAFCKLLELKTTWVDLEKINQDVHSQLHAKLVA